MFSYSTSDEELRETNFSQLIIDHFVKKRYIFFKKDIYISK